MIELYKDGDRMAIATDCENESEFISQVSSALAQIIEREEYRGDWEFQIYHWLDNIIEIVEFYRSKDLPKKIYRAGCVGVGSTVVFKYGEN